MSYIRKALFIGASLVTAGAVRRLITHEMILPIPLPVCLHVMAILWIGYVILVARDDVMRHLDERNQREQRDNERTTDLMMAALDARMQPSALHRVK